MNRKNDLGWFMVALLVAVACVYFSFYNFLQDPAHSMTTLGGDGLKNYCSYLYHVNFGKGLWFEGMNYPYGEHLSFADGQPLLAVPLTWLGVSTGTALTVMHLAIALSFVLALLFIYRILKHFGLHPLAAVLFAAVICFLSPQMIRVSGHFGLSYACYLPMVFFWFIRYNERGKLIYIVYFALLTILFTFLHPYFAGMGCIWAGAYVFSILILKRKNLRIGFRHVLPVLISVVIIFAFVQLFMKLTDPVTDRPTYPLGILSSFVVGEQVFSSSFSPYWQIAKEQGLPVADINGEQNVYPGIVCLIIILALIVRYIVLSSRSNKLEVRSFSGFEPVWLIMAFTVLLFCMGVPLLWGGEALIEHLSVLRQFRSIGRFAWMFYLIISVYGAVNMYKWFERKKRKRAVLAYSVLIIAICLWAIESVSYVNFVKRQTTGSDYNYEAFFSKNNQSWEQFLKEHNRDKKEFQAILLMPYIHVGSEKIWLRGENGWLVTLGLKAAMQLHLPVVNVMLSRTSWSQTFSSVRIDAGPFAQKPLLDLADQRPYLFFEFFASPLDEDERYLLQSSEFIGKYDGCNIYACYPSRIRKTDEQYRLLAKNIASLLPNGGDTAINGSPDLYIDHMDQKDTGKFIFGNGGRKHLLNAVFRFADLMIEPPSDSQWYEFSCWALLSVKDYKSPYFALVVLDSAGNEIMHQDILGKNSRDNSGMWVRMSEYFRMPAAGRKLVCVLNDNNPDSYLALDELMLRRAETIVISKDSKGRIMANNHLIQGD